MGNSWRCRCGQMNKHRRSSCECGASKTDPSNHRIQREEALAQRMSAQKDEPPVQKRAAASG